MKVTAKGFLHWHKYEWEDKAKFVLLSFENKHDVDYVFIREQDFEMDIPDDFDPVPKQVETLKAEKQKIVADAHVKAAKIEQMIQSLLAIEYRPEVA